ncbi:hypothetical protein PENTCL1PPCAC_8085, partial [Pristionchus entomophagus]
SVLQLVLIALLFIFISQVDPGRLDFRLISSKLLNTSEERRIPKILAWTPYFSARLDERIRTSDQCPFQCEVYNRSELSEDDADVIVFHFRDLHEHLPLPKNRRPSQIYVSFLFEAPAHAGNAVNIRKVGFT